MHSPLDANNERDARDKLLALALGAAAAALNKMLAIFVDIYGKYEIEVRAKKVTEPTHTRTQRSAPVSPQRDTYSSQFQCYKVVYP